MSRKNNLQKFQTVTNGNMALSSITSPVTCIQWLDNIGLQMNFTGSPVGTFSIQVSADYDQDASSPPNVLNAGNWVTLTPPALSAIPVASGSADSIYVDLNQLSAPWIRLVYTRTSGSGTLNAFITAKLV